MSGTVVLHEFQELQYLGIILLIQTSDQLFIRRQHLFVRFHLRPNIFGDVFVDSCFEMCLVLQNVLPLLIRDHFLLHQSIE